MIGTLYIKSSYSMLNSTLQLESIFMHAKKNQYDFVALTDYQNLHGLYKFLVLSKKYQIKPIIGLEVRLKYQTHQLNFLLYARNDMELSQLIAFSSMISINPELNLEDVFEELNHLYVVFPSNQAFIDAYVENESYINQIIKGLTQNIKAFSIGLSLQNDKLSSHVTPIMYKIAKDNRLLVLPTRKTSYAYVDEHETYQMLRKIENPNSIDENEDLSFLSKNELMENYHDYMEVFVHMDKIFGKTMYHYLDNQFKLPKYPTKDDITADIYLNALATKGLQKRLEKVKNPNHETYQKRLLHELDVIHQMGYDDYFLIVYDFVRFAKTNDVLVGPGRGSAAGSLVAYCLGITDVNPIEYDLLFERFLNVDRKTMPDIDLDFPDNKRDLVIDYVKEKYGKKHVVSISTFTTFAEKSSLRDIAKIMKLDQSRINAIVKSVLKNTFDETDQEGSLLIRMAKTLEGLPRQTGTHAAGIILSEEDLSLYVPLQIGPHQMLQSQFEASDLESLGFLKIDFLGLRNLTIIDDVMKLESLKFKLSDIPLDDSKTFETLKNVDVTGIFQLESAGMRNTIRKMQPSKFEDIVALLALFRPGPMEFIDDYIARLHGDSYDLVDAEIDDILKPTFGIIVYQEQIMKIAQSFAGYSLSQADLLRRGIAKKDKEILEKEKNNFIQMAISNGRDQRTAIKIYDYIEKFADYGFNRSHSVSYALLAYQMAYLKTHYYQAFMAVLMSHIQSNTEGLMAYIDQVQKKGFTIYGPNINISTDQFIKHDNGLLSPLTMIKGIGNQIVSKILSERKNGIFKDFLDFKLRMKDILNDKLMKSLIYAGALDGLGLNHANMIRKANLDESGFENFIDDYQEKDIKELEFDLLKSQEKEVLGFNLTYTFDEHFENLKKKYQIKTFDPNSKDIRVLGKISHIKEIKTKKGDLMAFIDFDAGVILNLTLFPKDYEAYKTILSDKYLIIEARIDKNGYIINKIEKVKV